MSDEPPARVLEIEFNEYEDNGYTVHVRCGDDDEEEEEKKVWVRDREWKRAVAANTYPRRVENCLRDSITRHAHRITEVRVYAAEEWWDDDDGGVTMSSEAPALPWLFRELRRLYRLKRLVVCDMTFLPDLTAYEDCMPQQALDVRATFKSMDHRVLRYLNVGQLDLSGSNMLSCAVRDLGEMLSSGALKMSSIKMRAYACDMPVIAALHQHCHRIDLTLNIDRYMKYRGRYLLDDREGLESLLRECRNVQKLGTMCVYGVVASGDEELAFLTDALSGFARLKLLAHGGHGVYNQKEEDRARRELNAQRFRHLVDTLAANK